ncbi:ATP-binding cassette domain-containing protein [Bacillus paramycoides]|uniref:ATP-binding cassette domain-containing protein n=1 Tax=Bacillus paramycoides TaxID=2026194 RepID=UPI002E1CE660|nr:ATP-binding cassette domain-containing protein [Bacillus paramycoides]MED0972749.1 ATP-binding cassette domain-containing protein [Bacillus paramycoides]
MSRIATELEISEGMEKGVHISLKHVEKQFAQKEVLKEINLDIHAGEFVAVVGKSGSGKSTLLRLIAGVETETSGELLFNNVSLKDSKVKATMMYQDSRLLPWEKVVNNVALGIREDWERKAEEALEAVGLLSLKKEWPATLSGGQKQRVALARALVHEPTLLLLDEPLSALDALTRLEMQNLIEKIWLENKFTTILVTHDVREAVRLADRIILIEDGYITMNVINRAPRPRKLSDISLNTLENKVLEKIVGDLHVI